MSALPEYTLAEVAQHRTRESCWVVLAGRVYDFTPFIDEHPGGARGLLRYAGTDASEVFAELHSLNEITADPSITKVLHGADNDVLWLQRDFSSRGRSSG